jgi:hypothetical protein
VMSKCEQTFLMTTGMMLMALVYVCHSTVPYFKVLLAAPLRKKIQMCAVYIVYEEKKYHNVFFLMNNNNFIERKGQSPRS